LKNAKAFANFSAGLLQPSVLTEKSGPTLKAFAFVVWPTLAALNLFCLVCPRVVASSNPDGLKVANAFGVVSI
jgi:hypothetical protein